MNRAAMLRQVDAFTIRLAIEDRILSVFDVPAVGAWIVLRPQEDPVSFATRRAASAS